MATVVPATEAPVSRLPARTRLRSACGWNRRSACRWCFNYAHHCEREYQCRDDHDRGEGCRLDQATSSPAL